jgi:hypothetical protein
MHSHLDLIDGSAPIFATYQTVFNLFVWSEVGIKHCIPVAFEFAVIGTLILKTEMRGISNNDVTEHVTRSNCLTHKKATAIEVSCVRTHDWLVIYYNFTSLKQLGKFECQLSCTLNNVTRIQ